MTKQDILGIGISVVVTTIVWLSGYVTGLEKGIKTSKEYIFEKVAKEAVRTLEDGLKALAYIPNIMEDENPISVLGFINSYDHSDATNACEWHLSEFEGGRCVDMLKAKIEEKEAQAKEIGDCLTYLRSRLAITMIDKQEQ